MRILLLAGVLSLVGLAALQESSLDRLAWLAGCWERQRGDRVTFEMWMPPAGGLMLGASRSTAGGVVRETETLRLEVEGSHLVYTASPSGQAVSQFRGAAPSDSGFMVENPTHDFPQRIIYRRRGSDSLVARIEGPGRDGATRGVDFPYRRVACDATP